MNQQTFLQTQAVELRRLLDGAGDDPILAPQLRDRLDDVEKELEAVKHQEGSLWPQNAVLPRAAIFLRGGDVQDSEGIRPSLAGEALIQYEKMFTEQALHDERQTARRAGRQRRRRGTPAPGLLFTGTPRGSFGLEFVPQANEDGSLLEVHAQSLQNVAGALVHVAISDAGSLDETIKQIPACVVPHLKKFLTTLAEHGAELRLAFPGRPSQSLSIDQVKIAAERLEREVSQEIITISGVFRGVTRESGVFDLNPDNGDTITGTVADHLTEEDLERIDALTNDRCAAEIQKTTVSQITGAATPVYVLIDAR